jgi:hypothetical protein
MRRYLRSIISRLTLLAVVFAASGALAQGVTGSAVTGTIKEGGKPVAGASVQLRNPATGETFNATSGSSGQFFLDNVTPGGPYTLTVSAEGLQPATVPDLQLTLGQKLPVDVQVRSAFVEEIAVVARRDALADKGRTGASTTLRSATITELPLQGRNFTDLILTDPRVTSNSGGVSIAGQNNRLNNIQIDGGVNNDLFGLAASGTPGGQANAKPLSIEAIQEFNVQVAPFDVRYGSFAGGLVNAVTKSGTNNFHGTVFGYYQARALANQNAYLFRNGAMVYDTDPVFLNYNTYQYGAAVGGPIIPDKVHFFIVADIQQKQSAFGNSNQIGGVDSASDISAGGFDKPIAERFASILTTKYGIANAGDALAPSLGNPDRNIFAKVTANVIDNNRLELSYNYVKAQQDVLIRAPTSTTVPGRLRDGYELSNSGYGQANSTNTGRVKLTTNWDGGNLSNEFLAGVSIVRDERAMPSNTPLILVRACNTPALCNLPNAPGHIGANDAYLAAGGERFSQANILDQDIYQLQDNLTLGVEKHRLTFGTSNEFFAFRNVFLQAATGVWAFDSLDSFEAGTPSAFQRRFGVSPLQDPGTAKFSVSQLGFYAQDEWPVVENLSLNVGMRVDVPLLSRANTNPALLNSPLNIDTGTMPSGNPLLSPRIGFNLDLEGNSDTIVRGGVGVFSGRPPYVWLSNAYSINGLSQVELTCALALNTPVPKFNPDPAAQPSDCSGGTGVPTPPTQQGEIDYFDPGTRYPQNLRGALGVDKRLPWGIVATADLLYTEDINGWYVTDDNLRFAGTDGEGRSLYGTFPTTATFSTRLNRIDAARVAQAVKVSNKSGGKVYSGTLQLQKQFGRRYGVSVGYTYSKSLDRMSLTSSQALSNFQFAPLDGDIANRNVRPSAFDRPHKITVTGTAALPYGFLLGLSYVGQSGTPYTWTVNGDVNADGINGNDVPFIPANDAQISFNTPSGKDPVQYAALSTFIDSQTCLRRAKGGFIERGACRNPWQDFVDLRLSWLSPDLKGQRIEIQYDIFNVLNLIDSRWGHFNSVAQFENGPAFLQAVGYDDVNRRPKYAYRPLSTITSTVYSPTLSRWRMQLGAKYVF